MHHTATNDSASKSPQHDRRTFLKADPAMAKAAPDPLVNMHPKACTNGMEKRVESKGQWKTIRPFLDTSKRCDREVHGVIEKNTV